MAMPIVRIKHPKHGDITQRVKFDLDRTDFTWVTGEEVRELLNIDWKLAHKVYNWGYVRGVRKNGDKSEVVFVEAEANALLAKRKAAEQTGAEPTPEPKASAIMPATPPLPPAPEDKVATLHWKHQAKVAAKVEKLHSFQELAKVATPVTPQVSTEAPGFDTVLESILPKANPRELGTNPRALGTNPRAQPAPPPVNNDPKDRFPSSMQERVLINKFLHDQYLIDKSCYRKDWSDQKAAEFLGVQVHHVTNIRRAFHNTGWGNEEMDQSRQLIVDFEKELDEYIAHGKALQIKLNKLRTKLGHQ